VGVVAEKNKYVKEIHFLHMLSMLTVHILHQFGG